MENKIKEYRQKYNLTQENLARKVGITLSTMSNIEKSRTVPNVEVAIKIMRIFNETDIEKIFII